MELLNLGLPDPAANLACDEALLEMAELQPQREFLRFWEPASLFVVLGYGNRLLEEVQLESCQRDGISILRRCSGGGTVLQGPGCLNYSLVLQVDRHHDYASIPATNLHIMRRHAETFSRHLGQTVSVQGHTDLTLQGRKFSGNAQRRRRRALLFHGTFLLHFPIVHLEKYLSMPPRQPEYRDNRSHQDFVINLAVPALEVRAWLCEAWQAESDCATWPQEETARLAREKYLDPAWIQRL